MGLELCKEGNEHSGNTLRGYLAMGLAYEQLKDIKAASRYYNLSVEAMKKDLLRDIFNSQNTFSVICMPFIRRSAIFKKILNEV